MLVEVCNFDFYGGFSFKSGSENQEEYARRFRNRLALRSGWRQNEERT